MCFLSSNLKINVWYVSPVSEKCRPPAVQVALGKDPLNPTLVTFDSSNKTDRKYTVAASLDQDCNITGMIEYSWEIAAVDRDSGVFNLIYQYGKTQRVKKKKKKLRLLKQYIQPPGLQYIRCIARKAGVYSFTYDFGFFELVQMKPLYCTITPRQGKPTSDKFTVRCTGGYNDKEVIGYYATLASTSKHFGSITNHCSGKELETGLEKDTEIDPYKPLILSNWSSPTATITLPAGDPKEDYSVRVKTEAKYSRMPSLFDDVVVKVGWFVRKAWV